MIRGKPWADSRSFAKNCPFDFRTLPATVRPMENPEVPLEHVQKHIEEHAHTSGEKWMSAVALSTAIIAALAAIASLLAGDHANEAMISQIQAANQWSYYQAKGIKSGLLTSRIDMLSALGKTPEAAAREKVQDYAREQKEIKESAEKCEKSSESHLHAHVTLARSVTLFQISIAIAAICLLTKRRAFFAAVLATGAVGVFFLVQAILNFKG